MTEESDKRIEAARVEAEQQKQAAEFLQSLKPGDELVKPIYNPEAWVLRDKAQAAAKRGEIPRTDCRHSSNLDYLGQYQDEDPSVKRKGTPLNLFECRKCGMILWLVDPWGVPVSDR